MHRGYIKLFRKLKDWEWYNDVNTLALFLHLLIDANYKETKFRGYVIPVGSVVIGRKALAEQLCLSEQEIRTALSHLKSSNDIVTRTTNKFTIATITNYKTYQCCEQQHQPTNNQPSTSHQPTINQQLTTSKEGKKDKKVRKEITHPPFVSLTEKEYSDLAESYGKNIIKGYIDKINDYLAATGKKPYKDYAAAIRQWLRKDGVRKIAIVPTVKPITAEEAYVPTPEERKALREAIAGIGRKVV